TLFRSKIQARFIEWLIGIVAVIAHYFHGNLILALWLVWSVGGFAGGLAGGVLLEKLGAVSGKIPKSVLRLAYLVGIAGALLPFLNWGRGGRMRVKETRGGPRKQLMRSG